MAFVKFPVKVKVDGEYYAPGTIIVVDNAEGYVKQGAVEVKTGGKRAAKSSADPKRSVRDKKQRG